MASQKCHDHLVSGIYGLIDIQYYQNNTDSYIYQYWVSMPRKTFSPSDSFFQCFPMKPNYNYI